MVGYALEFGSHGPFLTTSICNRMDSARIADLRRDSDGTAETGSGTAFLLRLYGLPRCAVLRRDDRL